MYVDRESSQLNGEKDHSVSVDGEELNCLMVTGFSWGIFVWQCVFRCMVTHATTLCGKRGTNPWGSGDKGGWK